MAGKHSKYDEELPKAMQHKKNVKERVNKNMSKKKKKNKGLKIFGIVLLILLIILISILRNCILVCK